MARQDNPASEVRREPRTHLFVAATLYAKAGSAPVNVRNMSQSGALIEGAVLPDRGSDIVLRRGHLQAAGRIAWRFDNRAGVKLDASVHVTDWMARQGSAGQQRVDSLVAIVRNDGPTPPEATTVGIDRGSIEAELCLLRSELAELEASLVKDVILVATHPEIQTFDISLQRIDRMLKRLCAGG
jgi:hypothetical protein